MTAPPAVDWRHLGDRRRGLASEHGLSQLQRERPGHRLVLEGAFPRSRPSRPTRRPSKLKPARWNGFADGFGGPSGSRAWMLRRRCGCCSSAPARRASPSTASRICMVRFRLVANAPHQGSNGSHSRMPGRTSAAGHLTGSDGPRKFCIERSPDINKLPVAHTWFVLLTGNRTGVLRVVHS